MGSIGRTLSALTAAMGIPGRYSHLEVQTDPFDWIFFSRAHATVRAEISAKAKGRFYEWSTTAQSILITLVLLATVGLSSAPVWAQTNHLEGVIKARDGMKITMDAANAEVVVLLTDSTDVGQNVGALRSKRMPSSSLIPGLPIQVDGEYNSDKEFVAKKIRFKGNDLQQAKAIHAGVSETKKQAQQNQQELEKQNAELKAQNEALQAQQSQ